MSKIKNAKGRSDGNSGYTRVVGNEELGQLLSRVQATVISNGNELERLIAERSNLVADIDSFIEQATEATLKNGVYLCLKRVFKKSAKYAEALKGIEPDMLIFEVRKQRVCKIVELKDGDAFDTKKSQGEKEHLERFAMLFGARIPFVTEYYICSFNQDDKDQIFIGFKGVFDKKNILTGRELCDILNISYQEIVDLRKQDMAENLDYFITELLNISAVRSMINDKLKQE